MNKIIIGYSGHAYVAIEAAQSNGFVFNGYCENEAKNDLYQLDYLGNESVEILTNSDWFVGIGHNGIRKKIIEKFSVGTLINCIHSSATISRTSEIGQGVLVAGGAQINPFAIIGKGVVCNTASVIEHECNVGDFSFIAPGAVLAGNVTIGQGTFVGANAIVKEGVTIGNNVVIGAGAVIIKDVKDNQTVVGNPGKAIR